MRVKVSGGVAAACRAEVEQVVREAADGLDHAAAEVHVRAGGHPRVSYWITYRREPTQRERDRYGDRLATLLEPDGRIPARRAAGLRRLLEQDARDHGVDIHREVEPAPLGISGRAYAPPLPAVARVAATTRFLITLTVPADPRQLAYPQTLRYHRGGRRYATAPDITVASWQEHLLVVAAHEWRHVHQFRVGGVRSEVKADQWALARLLAWRAGRS